MQKYNIRCRKALMSDDIESIARYLHLTDIYIYTKLCQDPSDKEWVEFVRNCMKKENNIFNINHLSVVLHDDDIIGVMCVIPCGKKLNFTYNADDVSTNFADKLGLVTEGYFDPLMSETLSYDGVNITNVCIDSSYQGKGIGTLLMSYGVKEYGAQTMHLDVIASNEAAIKLYKRFGFEFTNEYYGYSGDDTKLLCYHMIRTPNTTR